MNTVKSKYILLGLTILALLVYFSIFFNLNITVSKGIMFSTPDSQTYYDVVNWFEHHVDSKSVSTRPLLYPLLLWLTSKIGGFYALWVVHIIFWLLSVNFTFLTIKHLTKNNFFALFGAIIMLSNLSLIVFTFHALTEVTTVLLLSVMLFFVVRKIEQFRSLQFFQTCLFFMVLLTVLKPTFSIPLLILLFIIFPFFYLKEYLKSPLKFLQFGLILVPLIIQISIIYTKYGQLKVSLIGSKTLTLYIVP